MSNINRQQLSENQKKAQQYLKDHRIEEVIGDILNTITHNRYEQPLIFMAFKWTQYNIQIKNKIKYLAKQLPNEILIQNGIVIENQDELDSIMQISFPQFDQGCNNIFRQALSREVYLSSKGLQTSFKNNLRHLIQLGLENQKHKVGLFACDSSCYSTFKPIFSFVQNALFTKIHPLSESFQYSRDFTFNRTTILNQEFKYFEDFSIKIKRNIDGYQYNSVMKSTERQQIQQKINSCLQNKLNKLFTQIYNLGQQQLLFSNIKRVSIYFDSANYRTYILKRKQNKTIKLIQIKIENLQSEDKTNIAVQYNKLIKESNALVKSGSRYREWPESRTIAFSHNKRYLIWINKEDHFELKCSGSKELNFMEYLIQSIQISQLLDDNLGFNFTQNDGFTTTKPIYQGLALKFKIKIRLPSSQTTIFKNNIENLKKNPCPYFEIKAIKKDSNRWVISLNKTYGMNWNMLVEKIENYIQALFKQICDKDQEPFKLNVVNIDQYATTQEDIQDEDNLIEDNQQHIVLDDKQNIQEQCISQQDKFIHSDSNHLLIKNDNYFLDQKSLNQDLSLKKEFDIQKNIQETVIQNKEVQINNKNTQQQNQITQKTIKSINNLKSTHQNNINLIQTQNQEQICQNLNNQSCINNKNNLQSSKENISILNEDYCKLDHIQITIDDSSDSLEEKKQQKGKQMELLTYGKELYFQQQQQQNINQLFEYPLDFDRIIKYKRIERGSNYSELSSEISRFIFQKDLSEFPTSDYEIQSVISESEPSVILQSYSNPQEFIKDSYFILRRNFKSVPFKSKMGEEDFSKSNQILLQFVQSIENDYKGELLQAKDQIYEKRIQECLNEYPLFSDRETFNLLKTFDNHRFSYGSLYFRSRNLKILGNLDDHLIIILTINQDDVVENLIELNKVLSKIKEPFYKDQLFGYATRNPYLCGTGLSIIYKINEVKRSNIGLNIVQTDENSNIITKYLEKEQCVQIELNCVDQYNLHQFAQDSNNHLVQIKLTDSQNQLLTEHQLTVMDCFDQSGHIVAPEKECYTYHKDIYERYIKNFNSIETPLELSYSPKSLKFIEISKDIKVSYEIRRNFEQFNFTKYMTYKEVNTLKQYFEKIFSKITNFHLKQKEDFLSYKTQTYTHNNKFFFVDIMKSDHVGITSFGKLKELQKSLVETFELLQKFQSDKYSYLRDEQLGYLSETGQRLGDNFYLKIELTVNPEELDSIQKLSKDYQYQLTNTSNNSSQKASYNNNIILEFKRCGYFLYEMDFIKSLIYALDKKDPKKQ